MIPWQRKFEDVCTFIHIGSSFGNRPEVRLTRLSVPADLSEWAVEEAIGLLKRKWGEAPEILFCSMPDLPWATPVAEKFSVRLVPFPAEVFNEDTWALIGKTGIVWSPGA